MAQCVRPWRPQTAPPPPSLPDPTAASASGHAAPPLAPHPPTTRPPQYTPPRSPPDCVRQPRRASHPANAIPPPTTPSPQTAPAVQRRRAPATARCPDLAAPQAATNQRARQRRGHRPRCWLETPANLPAVPAPFAAIATPDRETQIPPSPPHSRVRPPLPAQAPPPPALAALPRARPGPARSPPRAHQNACASRPANAPRHPATARASLQDAPQADALAPAARSRSWQTAQTAAHRQTAPQPTPHPLRSHPQLPLPAPPQAALPGSRARWCRSLQTTTPPLAADARCATTPGPASTAAPSRTT